MVVFFIFIYYILCLYNRRVHSVKAGWLWAEHLALDSSAS